MIKMHLYRKSVSLTSIVHVALNIIIKDVLKCKGLLTA